MRRGIEKDRSQWRACGLSCLAPDTYRNRSCRRDDAGLRIRLEELAAERRRFGDRRLLILLRQPPVDKRLDDKPVFRLYREERLPVRRRGGRKRALGSHAPMTIPQAPNQR